MNGLCRTTVCKARKTGETSFHLNASAAPPDQADLTHASCPVSGFEGRCARRSARAERRLGEMMKEQPKARGGWPDPSCGISEYPATFQANPRLARHRQELAHRATLRGRGGAPLKAPHARCARAMPNHKFHVGQVVIYRPGSRNVDAPSGVYTVTRRLTRIPRNISSQPSPRKERRELSTRTEQASIQTPTRNIIDPDHNRLKAPTTQRIKAK
jgi:hypothetical protein